MKKYIFVFDVESTDLYGEGFAFGVVVSDEKENIIDSISLKTNELNNKCCPFVKENILGHLDNVPTVETVLELRNKFYEFYMKYKDSSIIFSDVNYPVETNFLNDVVSDDKEKRQWNMPYPLYDIANFVNVFVDRAEEYKRNKIISIPNKLKLHNPLDDSKASLFCLMKYAKKEVKKILANV